MKAICGTVTVSIVGLAISLPPNIRAQSTITGRSLSLEARASVTTLLYAASETRAVGQRAADAKLVLQQREIESLKDQLAKSGGKDAQLMADLSTRQQRYIQELAALDRDYAKDIADFRDKLEDIASTPEGEGALREFNAGNQRGALDTLDRLRVRRRQFRQDAAEARNAAVVAAEAHKIGKLDIAAVIDRYQEIVGLAPIHEDWKVLSELDLEAGRLAEAQQAAEHAVESAKDDEERAIAFNFLGDVLASQRNYSEAQSKFEEGLKIDRRLAAQDPTSERSQREISVTLNKIGGVLHDQGDLDAARERYAESVKVARRIAETNDSSVLACRDLSVSLVRLGDVLLSQRDLAGAEKQFSEGLTIRNRLAAQNPESIELQNDIAAAQERLGDVHTNGGDLSVALDLYRKSLEIRKRLVLLDPNSEVYQSNVGVSLDRVGQTLFRQEDFQAALPYFQEGLAIAKKLAAANLSSFEQQRGVSVVLNHIGDVQVKSKNLPAARASYEESLRIVQTLVSDHPHSTDLQRDVSVSLNRVGDVQQAQGDVAGARRSYEESLRVRKRLVENHPSSPGLLHDLLNGYAKLSMLTGDKSIAQEGLDLALAKQAAGVLSEQDQALVNGLQSLAGH
jgi:tetratricopeptide (TPR) repeat protein